jgi:hypothetical protein
MSQLPAFDPLGLPAPAWLLFGLKVFGFWLHMFFMNLWLAGLLVGLVLSRRDGPAGDAARSMLRAMPIVIALGINAGIVPLLFLQVLYPQFFYTSTVLQAWSWVAIIGILIFAYYGVYVYVLGTKAGRTDRWVTGAGWLAATLFLIIGVIFTAEMRLLTAPDDWLYLTRPNVAGAVLGTHLAVGSTSLLRYAMMFGMALATTGAYIALDTEVFRGGGSSTTTGGAASPADMTTAPAGASRGAVPRLVFGLTILGLVVFGAAALLYLPSVQAFIGDSTWRTLAGAGPGLAAVAAAFYLARPGKGTAIILVVVQAASLLLNAITRQLVQAREIGTAFDLSATPVNTQISPIVLFLGTLVVGLGVMGWLLTTYVRAARAAPAS